MTANASVLGFFGRCWNALEQASQVTIALRYQAPWHGTDA
jgi:hypothetical protein